MPRLRSFAERAPVWFAVVGTLAFVVLVLVVVAVSARFPRPHGLEAGGAVGRLLLAAVAVGVAARLGWLQGAGLSQPGNAYAWAIIAPVFLYVVIVYPLLFTGTLSLRTSDPGLAALVAANGFAAGVMEEAWFRGLILYALVRRWGAHWSGALKSLLLSAVLFSLPHALNVLAGAEPMRVLAQLVWAVLLGFVFGTLVLAGGSVWPAAILHGLANAIVHVNRMEHPVVLTPSSAVFLAIAPLPLVAYGLFLLRRGARPYGSGSMPNPSATRL